MSKVPDNIPLEVPWLSPIIKKRKTSKVSAKSASTSSSTHLIVSPLGNWFRDHKSKCRLRLLLSVPTRLYKSQVTGYHGIATNTTPGDLVMSTDKDLKHTAYYMKESIGIKYIFRQSKILHVS